MIKKLFRFIKFLIIGTVWSYVFIIMADFLMINIWNFNFLAARDWQLMNAFWHNGGIIKQGKDYLFLATLLALIPLWITGWRRLYRINYLTLMLSPIFWYNDYIIKKYGSESPRIVLKNMGRSLKVKQQIENMLPKPKPESEMEVRKIRSSVQEKINSAKNSV